MCHKIIIYGAGAVGCVLAAAAMQNFDNDVEICVKIKNRDIILQNGISISGQVNRRVKPVFFDRSSTLSKKLYILTVKTYDLENAINEIKPDFNHEDCLLLVQNGYGIKEMVLGLLENHPAKNNVFQAVSAVGATLLSPGNVNYYGGGLRIEPNFQKTEFAEIWHDSFLKYNYSGNFKKDLWLKLVINSVVNPITAILGISNGCLSKEKYNDVKKQILDESLQIAESAGMHIELSLDKFNSFISSDNISSMLQDIRKGQRTEIDFINGALVKIAHELNIAAPVNQLLTNFVKIKSAEINS